MMVRFCLRPGCTAGILIYHHHPKAGLGLASPFWVQGTPPCPTRRKPAVWYMVSTAAEAMLQAKGWFQEMRRSWEPLRAFAWGTGKTQYHRNGRIRTDPMHHSLYHAWGKRTNTQSTRPSGWAPRGLRALPGDAGLPHAGVSLALQEGSLAARIPPVLRSGEDAALAQRYSTEAASWVGRQGPRTFTPLTLPCVQGKGQLS